MMFTHLLGLHKILLISSIISGRRGAACSPRLSANTSTLRTHQQALTSTLKGTFLCYPSQSLASNSVVYSFYTQPDLESPKPPAWSALHLHSRLRTRMSSPTPNTQALRSTLLLFLLRGLTLLSGGVKRQLHEYPFCGGVAGDCEPLCYWQANNHLSCPGCSTSMPDGELTG